MPAVLLPIVHHVELESEIDRNGIWQRQHQAGFLGREDGLSLALQDALAHKECLDLAGRGRAGRVPTELAGAQLLALDPGPNLNKLGIDLGLVGSAGLSQAGELVLLVAQDPFECEMLHERVIRIEDFSPKRRVQPSEVL